MALTKITTDIIADGAITSAKLGSGAVSASSLSSITTDNVSEGSTNLYFTNARVDTEIDSYLSGGTGVTYSSGAISIGQDVGTSATPTFGNITTTGYIAGPATFTIDPAAVGDNTGTVVIAGNLQVDGTTTTINSTTVNVDDLNIQLATGAINSAAANGAGITVDGASATITYDGTNDEWDFNKAVNVTGTAQATRLGLGVAPHATAGLNITTTNQHIRLNNGSELGIINVLSTGELELWGHGDGESINFRTGSGSGTVAMNIVGNNVGIGTDNPDKLLHIYEGNSGITPNTSAWGVIESDGAAFLNILTPNGSTKGISFSGNSINADGRIHYDGSGADSREMTFYTASTEAMRIDSSGNVGIGTDSPAALLHVAGDARIGAAGATSQLMGMVSSGGVFEITTSSAVGKIHLARDVGIGTDIPEEKLHVLGQAVFDNAGNTNRGNIILGPHGSGTEKWATVAGTHYNEATGSGNGSGNAGVMMIGSQSVSSANRIWIGHGPYELNPATEIRFGTHSATTHNLGGTTHMVIDSSGKVGIGTGSPARVLDVRTSATSDAVFRIGSSGHIGINENVGEIEFYSADPDDAGVKASIANFVTGNQGPGGAVDGNLIFSTTDSDGGGNDSPTEHMRLNSLGQLCIGDASYFPTSGTNAFYMRKDSTSTQFLSHYNLQGGLVSRYYGDYGNDGTIAELQIKVGDGGNEANIQTWSNSVLKFGTNNTYAMEIGTNGSLYVGGTQQGADINDGRLFSFISSTSVPACRFAQGSTSTGIPVMRIRHENASNGNYIEFRTDENVLTGKIYDSSGTMQYTSQSDQRLKENVEPMTEGLTEVLAMNPVKYTLKDIVTENKTISMEGAENRGFLAQELNEQYPWAVEEGGEDPNMNPWGVDYGKLTPILVKAIQELSAKLEAAEARIETLENP